MKYSQAVKISDLAKIAKTIHATGVEPAHIEVQYYRDEFSPVWVTFQSSVGEGTLLFWTKHPQKPMWKFSLLNGERNRINYIIESGYQAHIFQRVEYSKLNWDNVCKLFNQYVDEYDMYDILDYIGYSLPRRDEFEKAMNS